MNVLWLRRCAALLTPLFFLTAMLTAASPAVAQQRVTMKSGMLHYSGERGDENLTRLPSLEALTMTDVASKPVVMIPDGLRYVFVAFNNVAEVSEPRPASFERIEIPQMVPSGGSVLGNAGPVIRRPPFDSHGRRVLTMASAQGPVNLLQGVTEINPRYVKVMGLGLIDGEKYKPIISDMRFRTNSIPADELRGMIYPHINMNDAQQRLRVYKLFVQAARYSDASDELQSIMKQFPDLSELKDQEKALIQISAQEYLNEIDRRAAAGQHNLVITRLQNFPQEGIAGETLIRVRDKLKTYEETLQQRDRILAALERDLSEIEEPEFKKVVEEVVTEIRETMRVSTLPRLVDYDRLKDDKSLPVDQRYALALSGWVLGQGFTKARTLSVAVSAYKTRKLVERYMRASSAEERKTLLKMINEEEAGTPEFLARIVQNMPPIGQAPQPMAGAPPGFHELTCRGASPDSPPVTYYVQLPPEYDPRRFYPTIVALNGQNAPPQGQIDWWCGPPLADGSRPGQATRHGYIVVAPQWSSNGAVTYQFSPEEHAAVLNSLRDATKRFSIDTDRVFLTGLAAGADAAWDIGLSHPDLWAGILPIGPRIDDKQDTIRYISRYDDNGRGLPMYIVIGEKDGQPLTVRFGKVVDKYMRSKDYDCTIVAYQGRGLEDYFEEVIEMFRWMDLYRRNFKRTEFKDFTSMRPWDNFAWCVEIEEFAPRSIVLPLAWPPEKGHRTAKTSFKIVRTERDNAITLACDGQRVSLWLSPDFIDIERPIRILRNKTIQVREKPSAEVLLEDVRTRGDRQHPFWMKVTL